MKKIIPKFIEKDCTTIKKINYKYQIITCLLVKK